MKKISVLGSTGSIGTQTLDVVRGMDDICITGLAAGKNIDLLECQIREFDPAVCAVWEPDKARELAERVKDTGTHVVTGMDGLTEAASLDDTDLIVNAVVGMIGIKPTIAAIEAGKDVALANKETLVTAGHLIMPLAKEKSVRIIPVDSEHSAIFQCLNGERDNKIDKILLTASGGPFKDMDIESMKSVTVEDALRHPNWKMGKKVTIDSSTMVNKGLEVMEAGWLFGVSPDDIRIVIQPQSIIHSMVQFSDGAVIAQLAVPDMRLPIQYALTYPERRLSSVTKLDFDTLREITFEVPDFERFPALSLAYDAAHEAGSMPTVFNAADERAVAMFLDRRIGYTDIPKIISSAMEKHSTITDPTLDDILAVEQETYEFIDESYPYRF